jgi:hypothetical protein
MLLAQKWDMFVARYNYAVFWHTTSKTRQSKPQNKLYFKGLSGAQGRNRTTDTRIFNPLLYP